MTTFRSEETLVGLITLATVPWIVWTLRRGVRTGRLPAGRIYIRRDERPGAFRTLFALYLTAAGLMTLIAADLLTQIDLGS